MSSSMDGLQMMEYEIAVFIRRAEAARIAYLNYKDFDRSIYLLLFHLHEHGPQGIKTLAESYQLDISTASRQTTSLESKGYVVRTTDPKDARVSLLQITPLGLDQLLQMRQARQDFYQHLLTDWSEEERLMFGELLHKFNRTAEQYRSGN
ncbi:MarR family transcriptional regulator [Paenibacillus pectinilyticus]|uniref:MarR family transcriptional regulator n=1 Tax=Paenibacillus pectinilyticus TaxID=512399 RepID=A0A1C1A728_9BACL|nr:MarR family transcriptional regulator [Paenibacillus pectinilyticus]OCT16356.1 MarR family transcriptional regulator [Paenibacillus pectinilyticus]